MGIDEGSLTFEWAPRTNPNGLCRGEEEHKGYRWSLQRYDPAVSGGFVNIIPGAVTASAAVDDATALGVSAMRTTADYLAEVLQQAGVKRIYGVVGDFLNGFTDSLRRMKRSNGYTCATRRAPPSPPARRRILPGNLRSAPAVAARAICI